MKTIANGGGDRTLAVKRALELTGHEHPHVLINPSAASTEESYNRNAYVLTPSLGSDSITASPLG